MFEVTVGSSSKHDVLKLRWKGLKFSFDNYKGRSLDAVVIKAFAKALIAKSDDKRTKVIDIDSSFWAKSTFKGCCQAHIYNKKTGDSKQSM